MAEIVNRAHELTFTEPFQVDADRVIVLTKIEADVPLWAGDYIRSDDNKRWYRCTESEAMGMLLQSASIGESAKCAVFAEIEIT